MLLQLYVTNLQLGIQRISFLQGQNECITARDALTKFRPKDNIDEMPHNKLQRCRVTQGIFTEYLFSEEFVFCFVDT